MGFLDKIKKMIGTDEYEEQIESEEEVEELEGNKNTKSFKDNGRVVNIKTQARVKVVIVKPVCFQDCGSIVDNLKENKTVVLNLESTDKETSRRIIDFVSGAAYANNGQIKSIANMIFIITPYNVDVVGEDVIGELENNGVFFK